MRILQTLIETAAAHDTAPSFFVKEDRAYATCGQGVLRIVRFELDNVETSAAEFASQYGTATFKFNAP